jgi:hypothetical protein
MHDLSLPFGTIEAEDEGEEDVLYPFRASHATGGAREKPCRAIKFWEEEVTVETT